MYYVILKKSLLREYRQMAGVLRRRFAPFLFHICTMIQLKERVITLDESEAKSSLGQQLYMELADDKLNRD